MIKFKKNGRPTKNEKGLVKSINNILSSMDEGDLLRYDFRDETVTDGERLSHIWDMLNGDYSTDSKPETEEVKQEEPVIDTVNNEQIDTSTGEVLGEEEKEEELTEEPQYIEEEQIEEPNTEEMQVEDATIIDEIESEEQATNDIPFQFNPLSDPIKERSYNKKGTASVDSVEEIDFSKNTSIEDDLKEMEEHEQQEIIEEEEHEEKERPFDRLTNEGMNELDGKDRKEAAKALVQTVLDGYEMLHEIGKRYVQYPEEKIQEKVIKGEIDPTQEIPIDEMGSTTNPIEFFKEFNEQAAEALSYDPEFGEKVRPAMERVFAKKGWGMTDEQFLLVAFGKDLGMKAVQAMTLKKTANSIMDTFVMIQQEKNEAMRAAAHPAQTVTPDAIVTPPQQEERYEEEEAQPIYQHAHNVEEEVEYIEHEEEVEHEE